MKLLVQFLDQPTQGSTGEVVPEMLLVVCYVVVVVKVDISILVMIYASNIVGYDRRRPALALQWTTR